MQQQQEREKERPPQEPEGLPKVICERCGIEAVPLHLGCSLCEECCDCRPLGT